MRAINDGSEPCLHKGPTRRPWFTRPGILVPVAAALLVGGLVIGTSKLVPDSITGNSVAPAAPTSTAPDLKNTTPTSDSATLEAAAFLEKAAQAVERQTETPVRPDQFLYLESINTETHVVDSTRNGKTTSAIKVTEPQTRRQWGSPDGRKGWLIDPGVPMQSEAGESLDYQPDSGQSLTADGTPARNPVLKGSLPGSYNETALLPHDPDDLLKQIYKIGEGSGTGPDPETFVTVGDVLKTAYPLPQLNAALYRAAAEIPGIIKVDNTVDAAGRAGVSIARVNGGSRSEWVFDPKTYVLSGFREVILKAQPGSLLPAGTVTFSSAIIRVAVVDAEKQIPGQ